jgi:hypothetical protein
MDRRRFIAAGAAAVFTTGAPRSTSSAAATKKSVAAVATVYRKNSHADVLLSKILSGWKHDGGAGPNLRISSLYVDQFPDDDLSRKLAAQHGFPICKTIEEAITLGTNGVPVDGVLSIGEHGDYPWNGLGQHLYPRRRFFEEITTTLQRYGKMVPVFNDKHPGPQWSDALWMYERALELKIPWMAGSSMPVSFRDPDVSVRMGSQIEACVGVGYSGLDVYGFHTLEFLQCLIERRANAESGVRWVQSLPTDAISRLIEDKTIPGDLLDAALQSSGTDRQKVLQTPPRGGAVFLIKYADGLLVPVLMLSPLTRAISVALKLPGNEVLASRAEERPEPRYPHFAYLLKGIEQMVHTGRPAYPVQRTLLAAGVLDRLLRSRQANGQKIETPELQIAYWPVDYPHAPHIDLGRTW